jgi:hypothetical protein
MIMPDIDDINGERAAELLEADNKSGRMLFGWDWPGHISYYMSSADGLTFGTINGAWQCQHYYNDGQPGLQDRCLAEELPLTATTDEIVAWVKRCIEHWNKAQ